LGEERTPPAPDVDTEIKMDAVQSCPVSERRGKGDKRKAYSRRYRGWGRAPGPSLFFSGRNKHYSFLIRKTVYPLYVSEEERGEINGAWAPLLEAFFILIL